MTKITKAQLVQKLIVSQQAHNATRLQADAFRAEAHDYKLRFEAVTMQLEKLAQHYASKEYEETIACLTEENTQLYDEVCTLADHNRALTAARDASSDHVTRLRSRVFELEHNLDPSLIAAQATASLYKEKLHTLLQQFDTLCEEEGLRAP